MRPDGDEVADPQRVVGGVVGGGEEGRVGGDVHVAAEVDGDGFGGGGGGFGGGICGGCGGRGGSTCGGGCGFDEVAADHDVVLDDGFAGEDDVGRAVQEGAAGDLVACVLRSEERLGRSIGQGKWGDGGRYGLDVLAAGCGLGRHGLGRGLGYAGCFGRWAPGRPMGVLSNKVNYLQPLLDIASTG